MGMMLLFMPVETGEDIVYQADMLNYANLTELYVGLISLDNKPQQHYFSVGVASITSSSLALSPEDALHIVNNTAMAQHFYITGSIDEQGF